MNRCAAQLPSAGAVLSPGTVRKGLAHFTKPEYQHRRYNKSRILNKGLPSKRDLSSMFHVASSCQHLLISNWYPTAELWDQNLIKPQAESIRGRVSAPREHGCFAGKNVEIEIN